jgi:alpha-1,6-mannosyltransferase
MIPAGLVALAATRIAEATPTKHALLLIVAVAVLLRGYLLLIEPLLSTDIYRYVWDGRVQAAGINPYRYFPAREALISLRDTAIFPNINRADYAVTIYPPVAQMFFFAITRLGENITVIRLGMLGCDAATAVIIISLLSRMGRPTTRLVAYAWHPLPMWEIANNGHVDALMVALMMFGLWLALTAKPLQGAAAIALGMLAKPLAVVALPAIWRPWDWKMPTLVAAIIGLCYLPYASVGSGVFGFLAAGYLNEEGLSTGDYVWPLALWRAIAGVRGPDVEIYFAGAALILGAMAMITALRPARSIESSIADIKRMLLVALLLLSPNYPWYFLAVVPFVALSGGAPAWAATIGALLLQEEAGWGEFVPLLVRKSVLYAAVLLACGYSIWRIMPMIGRGREKPP